MSTTAPTASVSSKDAGLRRDRHRWLEAHRRKVALGAVITTWIFIAIICAILDRLELGYWIELLNGATWPAAFFPAPDPSSAVAAAPPPVERGPLFYAVLALRTILNLGIPLSVVTAVLWLARGGLEKTMTRLDAFRALFVKAVLREVMALLKEEHVTVPDGFEDRLRHRVSALEDSALGAGLRRREYEAVTEGD